MKSLVKLKEKIEEVNWRCKIKEKEEYMTVITIKNETKDYFLEVNLIQHFGTLNVRFLYQKTNVLFKNKKIIEDYVLQAIEEYAVEKGEMVIFADMNVDSDLFVKNGYVSSKSKNIEQHFSFIPFTSIFRFVKILNEEILKKTQKKYLEIQHFLEKVKEKEPTTSYSVNGNVVGGILYNMYYDGYEGKIYLTDEGGKLILEFEKEKYQLVEVKETMENIFKKIQVKTRIRNLHNPPIRHLQSYLEYSEKIARNFQTHLLTVYHSYKEIENKCVEVMNNGGRMMFEKYENYYIIRALDYYFLQNRKNYDILKMGTKEEIFQEMEKRLILEVKNDLTKLSKII